MLPNRELVGWMARIASSHYDVLMFSDQMDKFAAMQEFNYRVPGGIIKNIAPLFVQTQAEISRIQATKVDEQTKAELIMKLLGWHDANYIILKNS
jgi:hypothetical protein